MNKTQDSHVRRAASGAFNRHPEAEDISLTDVSMQDATKKQVIVT